ncbi:Hsp70 family protein [Saccharopolyspora sp. TS4A08]|uniref:Hsp70 family protein n=1 Tax=Saccharopolyspora ipomoeae TaxID=3042027 RepID=A0ABT6PYE1_9PSEU|nr:Hsp70 family protein [Saccharopolyspora sp. TS4A08]MDI2032411.1 Hsp70 family protein [Saccharopolyspora sp. TS4A08]
MPYVLGVHLGATVTTAATARRNGGRWAATVPVPLAGNGPVVPTVLCRVQDGSFVAGEAAARQEISHHEWVARGFTSRLGDDLPLVVGSEFVPAQRLVAAMIEWVSDAATQRQGHPPEHIAIAHSAAWGPHRIHLVQQALSQLGITDVTMIPEPTAVALDYASKQRVDDQHPLVVANVGGSGFDATALRRRHPTFDVVGSPLDTDHPSGQDLDDALFELIREQFSAQLAALDASDVNHRAALAKLRAECVRAKEALSHQPGVSMWVDLPGVRTEFGLSRARYEQLARPHLERVPELISQAVQSASLRPDDVETVLLAGGVARTPLLKQLVAERLGTPPLVDVAPELTAASGAALAAQQVLSTHTDRGSVAETSVLMAVEGFDSLDDIDDEPEPVERPPIEVEPMPIEPPDEARAKRMKIIKLVVAAVLIAIGIVITFMTKDHSITGVMDLLK